MQETNTNHFPQGTGQPPHHMVYMVDTPKEGSGDGTAEDDPSKKKPKHRCQRRCSKYRQGKSNDTGTGDNSTLDSAEDDDIPLQQDLEQEDREASPPERAADGARG